jgi:hypothetical protein
MQFKMHVCSQGANKANVFRCGNTSISELYDI